MAKYHDKDSDFNMPHIILFFDLFFSFISLALSHGGERGAFDEEMTRISPTIHHP